MYINYVKIYQKGTPDETLFSAVEGDREDASGVSDAIAESESGLYTVFNLGGLRVADAVTAEEALSALSPGLYILKSNNRTQKIVVK